jgi:hypothetical protein
MKTARWTLTIMVVVALGLIGWDIFAAIQGGETATISHLMAQYGRANSILCVAVGILIGHWFWANP